MNERNVYVIDGEANRQLHDRAIAEDDDKRATRKNGERTQPRAAGAHGGWPRVGASCSMFISGSGHFLHRRWKTGAFYLLTVCVAAALHALASATWPRLLSIASRYDLGEADLLFGLLMVDVFVITVLLAGVHTAYALGRVCSGDEAKPTPHPLWAALASLLVPGWGQIVNGQVMKAMAFLFATYAGVLAMAAWLLLPDPIVRLLAAIGEPFQPAVVASALLALGLVVWTVSLYDAVLVARYRRLLPEPRRTPVVASTRRKPPTSTTRSPRVLRVGSR